MRIELSYKKPFFYVFTALVLAAALGVSSLTIGELGAEQLACLILLVNSLVLFSTSISFLGSRLSERRLLRTAFGIVGLVLALALSVLFFVVYNLYFDQGDLAQMMVLIVPSLPWGCLLSLLLSPVVSRI